MKLGFYKITMLDADGKTYELTPVDSAKMDGYGIAERLLEGVMFEFTIDKNGELQVEVAKSDVSYFKTNKLDIKAWCEEAKKNAFNECAFDGEEVVLYDHDKKFDEQADYWEAEPRFVTK